MQAFRSRSARVVLQNCLDILSESPGTGLKAADNMLRMTTSSSGPLLTKLAGIRGLKIIALQGPCSARLSQRHAAFFGVRTQALSTSCVPQHAKVAVAEPMMDTQKQFLDLDGETDEGDEFAVDSTPRSLASIFESEDEEVLEVDAALQDETLLIENCGLSPVTVAALHKRGIKSLFPIQKHVFDPAAAGRDLIGRAKTGSGKTLAFSLPVVEGLLKEDAISRPQQGRPPRCIILAPTRELAKQVENEFKTSAPTLELGCYYGGVDIVRQLRELRRGVDIVVGTPGRVIDLIERGALNLSQIKFFILDEADMMLSQGFDEDVDKILETVPDERQTMLFSATMPSWVKNLTKRHLKQPVMVDLVGEKQSGKLNEDIKALAVQVQQSTRASVLVDVLTVYGAAGKAMIFTQTRRDADEVAAGVAKVLPCESLHGDMSQNDRERKLDKFRKGRISVLVATDVAARGLDIPNVDLVLHYELPRDTESFLHRSGRTARAGQKGTTIALFTSREIPQLRRIVRDVGVKDLEIMGPPQPQQVLNASAKQVLRRLDNMDDKLKEFFMPAAKAVMEQSADPQDALCRALAALSGLLEVPLPRSLLTQQEGYLTLRVMSRPGRVTKTGQVYTIVRNVLGEEAVNGIGRVRLLPAAVNTSGDEEGAAFDLPIADANRLLEKSSELTSRGFTLDTPTSLPMEEQRGGYNDRSGGGGGRFNDNRGGYNRGPPRNQNFGGGGGYNNNRGSGGYSNNRSGGGYSNDRSSGSFGGRSNDRAGGGSYGNNRGSGKDFNRAPRNNYSKPAGDYSKNNSW